MEGKLTLVVKGFTGVKMKSVWVVLDRQQLTWYSTFDPVSGQPKKLKGVLFIKGATIEKYTEAGGVTHGLSISINKTKTVFDCEDATVCSTWYKVFARALLLHEENEKKVNQPRMDKITLGLDPDDEEMTRAKIVRAYKLLSRKEHPDKGGNADTFDKISNAYKFLLALQEHTDMLESTVPVHYDVILRKQPGKLGLCLVVVEDRVNSVLVVTKVQPEVAIVEIGEESGGKIHAGDRLVGINHDDCSTWFMSRVGARLNHERVPVGSTVRLTFERRVAPDALDGDDEDDEDDGVEYQGEEKNQQQARKNAEEEEEEEVEEKTVGKKKSGSFFGGFRYSTSSKSSKLKEEDEGNNNFGGKSSKKFVAGAHNRDTEANFSSSSGADAGSGSGSYSPAPPSPMPSSLPIYCGAGGDSGTGSATTAARTSATPGGSSSSAAGSGSAAGTEDASGASATAAASASTGADSAHAKTSNVSPMRPLRQKQHVFAPFPDSSPHTATAAAAGGGQKGSSSSSIPVRTPVLGFSGEGATRSAAAAPVSIPPVSSESASPPPLSASAKRQLHKQRMEQHYGTSESSGGATAPLIVPQPSERVTPKLSLSQDTRSSSTGSGSRNRGISYEDHVSQVDESKSDG
jgi:hypothetical protein